MLDRGRELLATEIAALAGTEVLDAHAIISDMLKRKPTTDSEQPGHAQAMSKTPAPATV